MPICISSSPLDDPDPGVRLRLEELGYVEHRGEDDHGYDVVEDPPPRVVPLDGVVVLDRLGDGQVALQRQHHGHEDRAEDGDGLHLVAEVRERVRVPVAERADVLPDRWKDAILKEAKEYFSDQGRGKALPPNPYTYSTV